MAEYLERVTEITGMTLVIPPISMKFPFSGETQRLIKRLEAEGTTSPIIEEFKQHIKHRENSLKAPEIEFFAVFWSHVGVVIIKGSTGN